MRNCWSSRLSSVFVLVFLIHTVRAQTDTTKTFASLKDFQSSGYKFPLNVGNRAYLTGTMGELRSTHFHAGLDIDAKVGDPVYAANDGYVYRATITTGGYGRVLYLRHPDGKATVYAHLSEYAGPVAEYVLRERYNKKQSEIDIFFKAGQFPVKKGDLIARSGNTGGSGGPHLHFELRGVHDEALNPMTLSFPEVQDNTPPLPQRVAFRTMDANARINDQFGRFEYAVQKKGKDYVAAAVNASGRIGVEVLGYDKQEANTFKFGINLIELYADNQKVFTQKIDKIPVGDGRNILTVIDFKAQETRGYRFNKLYVDDGNRLPYYTGSTSKNGIDVKNDDVDLEIRLIDFHNNSTSIFTTLKAAAKSSTANISESTIRPLIADITGSVLTLNVNNCAPRDESNLSGGIQIYTDGHMKMLSPSYSAKAKNIFLVDLNKVQPDSIVTCSGTWVSGFKDRVPSNTPYKYYSDLVDIDFPSRALFDTLFLSVGYDSTFRETFTVGTRMVPLQQSINIQLKPLKQYAPSKNLGVYRVDHNGYTFMNSNWKNGKVSFNSLSLGQFTFLYDSVPPTIRPVSTSSSMVQMRIRDELSGISYFEASINGEWLLMTYDYKTGVAYSERLDKSKPIRGDFEMKVVDNAGNETVFKNKIP